METKTLSTERSDYPVQGAYPRFHDWSPLSPLPFIGKLKPLSSAITSARKLSNKQLELTISHDVIKGVTPQMLHWWFCHIDDTMQYLGGRYSRYRVWHPFDHIHYKDLSKALNGTGSAGTRRHIVEAFGAKKQFLVNIVDRVAHLDDKGILLKTEQAGISIGLGNLLVRVPLRLSSLEHHFIPVVNGTQYESRLLIGMDSEIGRLFVNQIIRPMFIGEEMARAWVKHNVEEVGNFELFLPALYANFEN